MEISVQEIQSKIESAEIVLIGIGEEFESKVLIEQSKLYEEACKGLQDNGLVDLQPYVNYYFMNNKQNEIVNALKNLFSLVENKNYFVVSTCMNNYLDLALFRKDRVVQPCGNLSYMQCVAGCEDVLTQVPESFWEELEDCCMGKKKWDQLIIPKCDKCGERLTFNTLYAEKYNEKGYLEQWSVYMKWLQGTVNRKLFVLELGVGLQFPSVIRWPFERTVYYNKKAEMLRVHKNLYQLTPELKEQGYFIPQNAVDVLKSL